VALRVLREIRQTLSQVIRRYRFGMREVPSFDPAFRRDAATPVVSMSADQARDLERFLHALDEIAAPARRP
jgi:hypothetical protein